MLIDPKVVGAGRRRALLRGLARRIAASLSVVAVLSAGVALYPTAAEWRRTSALAADDAVQHDLRLHATEPKRLTARGQETAADRTGSIDPKAGTPATEPARPVPILSMHEAEITLNVPADVRASDNTTFVVEGKTYRLLGIEQVSATKVCSREQGERWACGGQARIAFRNAIAGQMLRCMKSDTASDGATLLQCTDSARFAEAPQPVVSAN